MEAQSEIPLTTTKLPDVANDGTDTDRTGAIKERRRKIIQTISLYIGFFSLGLSFSIVGPTLLDLQRNTGTTTEHISFVFISRSVIGLAGAVLAGFITDRVNHWMLLSLVMVCNGVMNLLIPHIQILSALCVIFAIAGFCGAFFDAAGNMVLLKVWGEDNGPWMQALHGIFGAGALMGPLLAEPFLKSRLADDDSATILNTTPTPEDTSIIYQETSGLLRAITNATFAATPHNASDSNITKVNAGMDVYKSEVLWAYLILAIALVIASAFLTFVGFIYSDIKLQCRNKPRKSVSVVAKEDAGSVKPEDKSFRMQLIALVFLFYLFYCILEMNYGNYLTVYAVKDLGWSEKEGARVTSGYWTTFTAGRGLGVLLVRVLDPAVMLVGDLAISILSIGVLFFFCHAHYMVLWVCTLTLGLGISTIFATGITWTEQYIKVTGIAGAVFMVAGGGGEMIGPILIGILFEKLGPISFIYVISATVGLITVLFGVMQCHAARHGKRKRKGDNSETATLQASATAEENDGTAATES